MSRVSSPFKRASRGESTAPFKGPGSGESLTQPRRVLPPVDEREDLHDVQFLVHAIPQLIREHPLVRPLMPGGTFAGCWGIRGI